MELFNIFALFALAHLTNSLPLKKNVDRLPVIPNDDQLKFMQKYGYLIGDPLSNYAAQYSEESIVDAIVNIQQYGGIEPTGILNNETIALMRKPRCGVKDIIRGRKKRYAITGMGWKKREITYIVENWNPSLGEEAVRKAVKEALDMWAPYGRLTFIQSNNPASDIKIAFGVGDHGDQYPFDGKGFVLAHAFYPYVRYGGSVHFDNDETWILNKPDEEEEGTDFFSVAVHEIGHALGLAHSKVPESIMFAYYKGGPLQLDYDDVMAMYQLYINKSSANEATERENERNDEENETEEPSTTPLTTETWTTPTTEPTTIANVNYDITSTEVVTEKMYKTTYHGDYETVEDHMKHDDKHGIPVHQNLSDICKGEYDAVAVLRRELFVFKGTKVWRFQRRGELYDGYPATLSMAFPNLPLSIEKIDAAYENKAGYIVFFSGNSYWIYGSEVRGPYNIENYRVSNVSSLNAILLWPKNQKTYLFEKDRFWRYDERRDMLDEGYPMDMNRWTGIPREIDAAITWTDDLTYFFKGLFFWRFDDVLVMADKHYPLPVPQKWFGCPETLEVFHELRYYKQEREKRVRNK